MSFTTSNPIYHTPSANTIAHMVKAGILGWAAFHDQTVSVMITVRPDNLFLPTPVLLALTDDDTSIKRHLDSIPRCSRIQSLEVRWADGRSWDVPTIPNLLNNESANAVLRLIKQRNGVDEIIANTDVGLSAAVQEAKSTKVEVSKGATKLARPTTSGRNGKKLGKAGPAEEERNFAEDVDMTNVKIMNTQSSGNPNSSEDSKVRDAAPSPELANSAKDEPSITAPRLKHSQNLREIRAYKIHKRKAGDDPVVWESDEKENDNR